MDMNICIFVCKSLYMWYYVLKTHTYAYFFLRFGAADTGDVPTHTPSHVPLMLRVRRIWEMTKQRRMRSSLQKETVHIYIPYI